LEEFSSFNKWQLEVSEDESPQNELEEIMKPEVENSFGSETKRDGDSKLVKCVTEKEKNIFRLE